MNNNISIFKNIKHTRNGDVIPIDIFLNDIKDGKWINDIIDYRNGKREKGSLPYATMCGVFRERNISGLAEPSGFICIDIDDVQPNKVKELICADKYCFAAWTSVSGKGVASLFKINPNKHAESFEGIQGYLFEQYQIIIDPSGRDVCRARYISYDPDIFINEAAAKFNLYPKPKPKALTRLSKTIFVQNDFDDIIQQIVNRNIDLVPNYSEWLQIGFALSERFGEGGRHYFHLISRVGHKYQADKCDKQFTACLNHQGHGITISSFYWYAKQAGIQTVSAKTKLISITASQALKGGRNKPDTIQLLKDVEGINESESTDIVSQVFDNKIDVASDDSLIGELEVWLRQNYTLRRNELTRKIEEDGEPMEDRDFNTIYIQAKKIFEKLDYNMLLRLINSDFTPDFNPLIEFIEANKEMAVTGQIERLANTITTDQPFEYVHLFIKKWMVGIIQSIYGDPCSLMLVLSGTRQNTGKTEFFRRLLPRKIRQYYAESKLDAGKDDEILMTQKLIIMDDEMSGKSKRDSLKLKTMTSKKWFSLREPYGRANIDLKRLAVLAGTSNEDELINDPTGNRRIIPINVLDINHDVYNSIDKTELFIEAHHLYNSGFTSELSREDIQFLNDNTSDFEATSMEADFIQKYYEPCSDENQMGALLLNSSEIKMNLENYTGQRQLNLRKIGLEMKRLGFIQKKKKTNGTPLRKYILIDKRSNGISIDPLPF